jgi:type II secretory pathway pseudopilin PulG
MTLIELLLHMALSVIILAVVGAMLVSSTRAQTQVSGATSASTVGQLIMRSVQTGVRTASQVNLPVPSGGAQVLTVRTQDGLTPVSWSCQVWYFTPASGGSVYTKRIPATTPYTAPDPGNLSSWTLLGTGVSVTGAPVFTASVGFVTVNLSINAGAGLPQAMKSTSNTLNLVTVGAPCF